jgi:hypothetical protein
MSYIIGVDFDNTIVSYDDILHKVALERGLIQQEAAKSKKEIRDRIRRLPDGENEWQKVQAVVYGPRMEEARLIEGVREFFGLCKQHRFRVFIISHKTKFANFDATGTNLRTAAVSWMRKNRFFEADGFGLYQEDIYFESTRLKKIERIRQLRCTHFIDDLEEIFLEDTFPADVEKILYAPHPVSHLTFTGVKVRATWKDIKDYFFDAKV